MRPPGTKSATNYIAVPNMDCNFDDLSRATCTGVCTLLELEAQCDATAKCIGFNVPGDILKAGCTDWKSVPPGTSTFYFKPDHTPPAVRSSCAGGFCSHDRNGTYPGADCGGHCPVRPQPPPLPGQLDHFAQVWQNSSWNATELPATPSGDPVMLARNLLAKYSNV